MSAHETFITILVRYRKHAGLTQEQAAAKLRVSPSTLRKIEQDTNKPQRDFAKQCDELFGTLGVFATLHEQLVAEPHPDWFAPRAVYEDKAAVITEWEQRGVPGLLQTEDYARAVIRACRPYATPEALEQKVSSRLGRQEILSRDSPPKLWAVIAEGALRQVVGGHDVMREQVDHLIKMSGSPQAVIQVLPFSASTAPGADGAAALFEFLDSSPVVAYLEGWGAGRVVENPKEVADIATALSMIKGCALSPADSQQLMTEIRS
jgi:transcriptional regulator with XRE-family HTH domain